MRGNKILSIALVLSIVLSMVAFVAPVRAQEAVLTAPTIVNALYGPGSHFTIDILVNNVVQMWSFNFTLSYDPTIIQATDFLVNPTDPITGYGFRHNFATNTINNEAGYLVLGSDRGPSGWIYGEVVGIGDGATRVYFMDNPDCSSVTLYWNGTAVPSTSYTLGTFGKITFRTTAIPPAGTVITADYFHRGLTVDANFPVTSIGFDVVGRGISPLAFTGAEILDVYFNPIVFTPVDGVFDNRFQGHLTAPTVMENVLPGGVVELTIMADHVRVPTWGVSFFLDYNSEVLTALDGIVTVPGTTYIQVEGWNQSTVDPIPLTTVRFQVNVQGWSEIGIRDITAVSVLGDVLFFDSTNGGFASISVVDLYKRGAYPDTHVAKFGTIDNLNAIVYMNATGGPILFNVVFTVFDASGGTMLGTIETAPAMISPFTQMTVTAAFDTTVWGTPKYHVYITAQTQYDLNGDGVMDTLGAIVKPVPILVKP